MHEFGRALKRWRRVRGIKQSHVAELLSVTQATVSRWERGQHRPNAAEAKRLQHLLEAPLDASGDAALRRLVETSGLSVHLICDLTHRLLAASPARLAEWRCSASDLYGVSLWPFATDEIRSAESRLVDLGWRDAPTPSLSFWTGANDAPLVTIYPGILLWETFPLSDGTLARLVTNVPANV